MAAAPRPRLSARSKSRKPRAHRDDTPEARRERARQPKTHPTRAIGGVRKDKPAGRGGAKHRSADMTPDVRIQT
jgi:hypothetical protein